MTRSLFRKAALLLAILVLAVPVSLRAQNVMEGTPYTPMFEVTPRGMPDMIATRLRVNQVYDTNLVSSPVDHLEGTYSSFDANISFVHQQPGSIFKLTYDGGGNVYPQYPSLNEPSNAVRATLRQTVTKRLNLAASGDWGSVPGGAYAASTNGGPPQLGGGDEDTEILARRHISEDASLSLQYQLSPHTYFAWGGNLNDIRYEPATFSTSRSEDAYGAYYYQFTQAQNVSFGYSNQWIGFPGHGIHSQVRNVLVTYSNALSARVTFSGYVGPAFVEEVVAAGKVSSPTSTTYTSQANVVGGASLKYDTGHTNVVFRYDRMYSRGSGLAGTSLRQTATSSVSQSFSRHLVLALHVNYTKNDLASFGGETDTSWRIQPTMRYHMTERLWLTASDGYVRAVGLTNTYSLDRNIATFGVEYDVPNLILEK